MAPYREEVFGGARLILGDCREVLPSLAGAYDAVVSDPPYGIEELVGGYSREGATIANDKNLDCCFRALDTIATTAHDIRMRIFYSCRITPEFFERTKAHLSGTYVGEIIWDKKAPGMTKTWQSLKLASHHGCPI